MVGSKPALKRSEYRVREAKHSNWCRRAAKDFIRKLLVIDEHQRMSAEEAIEHPVSCPYRYSLREHGLIPSAPTVAPRGRLPTAVARRAAEARHARPERHPRRGLRHRGDALADRYGVAPRAADREAHDTQLRAGQSRHRVTSRALPFPLAAPSPVHLYILIISPLSLSPLLFCCWDVLTPTRCVEPPVHRGYPPCSPRNHKSLDTCRRCSSGGSRGGYGLELGSREPTGSKS